jgi:hypothetical protein
MRILITGSRDWTNHAAMQRALMDVVAGQHHPDGITIVHGGARGADQMAGKYGEQMGANIELHPADWDKFGRGAGFRRNAEMVEEGADVCLAFFANGATNRGTLHCSTLAARSGIPVIEVWG